MVYIAGLTIVVDTVGTNEVAEYMGYIAVGLNVGSFAGSLLGGVVFDKSGYNAVWYMMLGFIALDVLLRFLMIEKTTAEYQNGGSENFVITETEDKRPVSIRATSAPNISERGTLSHTVHTPKNLLPPVLTLLFSTRMNVALLAICVQALIFSVFEAVLSLYVQEIWSFNALASGLIFLPLTIPAFFAPLTGRLVDRTSARLAITFGFLSLCPVLIMVRFVNHNTLDQKVLMCALLFFVGLGVTATLDPLMAEVSHVAERREREEPQLRGQRAGAFGQAYSLSSMAWSVGNIVGPIAAGSIRETVGWSTMGWELGLICGIISIPCVVWLGRD
ncbi:MAG: hypothetical protein M1822_000625 [Bathelium mastoideum]|nr:MAG: hypothetical protein M1822_000625 [Bathelium mastoideum]